MTDTTSAPADTGAPDDLQALTPEELREELARTRANLTEVLQSQATWQSEQQGGGGNLTDTDLEAIDDVLQAGAPDEIEAVLDKLGTVVDAKPLIKVLRKNLATAAAIRIESERQGAEQARATALRDAGAPDHLAEAVGQLLGTAEPTPESVAEVMERFNLGQVVSPEERRREEEMAQRRAARQRAADTWAVGTVDDTLPPDLDMQIREAEKSGNHELSFALKQKKLERARADAR